MPPLSVDSYGGMQDHFSFSEFESLAAPPGRPFGATVGVGNSAGNGAAEEPRTNAASSVPVVRGGKACVGCCFFL